MHDSEPLFNQLTEQVCVLTGTDPELILAEVSLEYCWAWNSEHPYAALQRDRKLRKGFECLRGVGGMSDSYWRTVEEVDRDWNRNDCMRRHGLPQCQKVHCERVSTSYGIRIPLTLMKQSSDHSTSFMS
jgi:hypothetical protein